LPPQEAIVIGRCLHGRETRCSAAVAPGTLAPTGEAPVSITARFLPSARSTGHRIIVANR